MSKNQKFSGLLPREIFKLLAMAFMLLDHLGASFYPEAAWMRCAGRLAFPMFAFGAAEGFSHTHSRIRYLLVMVLFAILSEVPYDLLWTFRPFSPELQNVLFTFSIALLAMILIERVLHSSLPVVAKFLLIFLTAAAAVLAGKFSNVDYGGFGVLMVLLFYYTGFISPALIRILTQILFMFVINWYLLPSIYITIGGTMIPAQGFALLSLPLIWLYSGQKWMTGKAASIFKYVCYAFYPLHMLLIWIAVMLK